MCFHFPWSRSIFFSSLDSVVIQECVIWFPYIHEFFSFPSAIFIVVLQLLSCVQLFASLQLHGLQHARLPCPSLSLRACSDLCPLNRWCHSTISSSVVPFSSCPQSFPASGSFPMSRLSSSSSQSNTDSASFINCYFQSIVVRKKILGVILIFLNVLRLLLWSNVLSILANYLIIWCCVRGRSRSEKVTWISLLASVSLVPHSLGL